MRPGRQSIYQVNAQITLNDLSRSLGRQATLADLPDAELDRLASLGFEWVWLLGVWQRGPAGLRVVREHAGLRRDLARLLPDLREEDVVGSPFAVQDYRVHDAFGGEEALADLRRRMARRGLRLMLDFVPNHVALDHPWVKGRPEFFVEGTEEAIAREPRNWVRLGGRILAHGRDPHFPGWSDTLQVDYSRPEARAAMAETLRDVARRCDGARCDMAMLMLNDVFRRTWPGRQPPACEFWPGAIEAVRRDHPGFTLVAEAYWGLETVLLDQGFDYVYDKTLYDHLAHGDAASASARLQNCPERADRWVRFIENHDEPRSAAVFAPARLRSAAVVAALAPGAFLCHQGQMQGWRIRPPMQLGRRPPEPDDPDIVAFYEALLAVARRPEARTGRWQFLPVSQAWEGNRSWQGFVVWRWGDEAGRELVVVVNLGRHRSQCLVRMPPALYAGRAWTLRDLMGPETYDRDGDEMSGRGLFLDMEAGGFHAFAVEPAQAASCAAG